MARRSANEVKVRMWIQEMVSEDIGGWENYFFDCPNRDDADDVEEWDAARKHLDRTHEEWVNDWYNQLINEFPKECRFLGTNKIKDMIDKRLTREGY